MPNFKQPKHRDAKYLSSMRDMQCQAKALGGCMGDVVGAHLDSAGGKGVATKTNDFWAGPLCFAHHQEEGRGAKKFWHRVFATDTWFMIECLKAYRKQQYEVFKNEKL